MKKKSHSVFGGQGLNAVCAAVCPDVLGHPDWKRISAERRPYIF